MQLTLGTNLSFTDKLALMAYWRSLEQVGTRADAAAPLTASTDVILCFLTRGEFKFYLRFYWRTAISFNGILGFL